MAVSRERHGRRRNGGSMRKERKGGRQAKGMETRRAKTGRSSWGYRSAGGKEDGRREGCRIKQKGTDGEGNKRGESNRQKGWRQ